MSDARPQWKQKANLHLCFGTGKGYHARLKLTRLSLDKRYAAVTLESDLIKMLLKVGEGKLRDVMTVYNKSLHKKAVFLFVFLEKKNSRLLATVQPKIIISWNCAHPQAIWDVDEFVSSSDL